MCYFIILLVSYHSFAKSTTLPDFGTSANLKLNLEQEATLGRNIMYEIRRSVPLMGDTLLNSYINDLGNKLTRHSSGANNAFHFFVVQEPTINAFAFPGGYIGVHTGLIEAAQNESELAGVLAHEVSHVTQRHIARLFERADQYQLPTLAAMIGSLILATQNAQAGMGALAATMGAANQMMINFTRENEAEADRVGVDTLAKAGFDPMGMPHFFARMHNTNRYNDMNIPEYLRTHPVTPSRIADTAFRAEKLKYTPSDEKSRFYIMQARQNVLLSRYPKDALDRFEKKLKLKHYLDKEATEYGYALALSQQHQYKSALPITQKLVNENPDEIAFTLLEAQIYTNLKEFNKAQAIYLAQLKKFPDHPAVLIDYATLLLQNGKSGKARQLLRRYVRQIPDNLYALELLSEAQAASGYIVDAHQTRADLLSLLGDFHSALRQLDIALKQKTLTDYDKAKINAKKAQFETLLKESKI